MRRNRILVAMTIVVVMAFFLGCSDDKNPAQTQQYGEVSGTVKLVGTWPAAGNVQVSIWANWPPTTAPAGASAVFAPGQNTQTYKIEGLNKGSYPVVTVGWRDPANPAGAKVLGIYWANSDSVGVADGRGITLSGVQALPINVADGNMTFTNINIKGNLDFAK
jgi:hypothetical protein